MIERWFTWLGAHTVGAWMGFWGPSLGVIAAFGLILLLFAAYCAFDGGP